MSNKHKTTTKKSLGVHRTFLTFTKRAQTDTKHEESLTGFITQQNGH